MTRPQCGAGLRRPQLFDRSDRLEWFNRDDELLAYIKDKGSNVAELVA